MKLVKYVEGTLSFPKAKTLMLFLIAVLTYSSCKQEPATDLPNLEDQEILNYLQEQGFNTEAVKILDDFVDYEDDAGWDKADLLKTIRGEHPEEFMPIDPDDPSIVDPHADDRHRGIRESNRTDAVTKSNVASLTYYIRSSVEDDCGTAWVTSINDAAAAWNALSYCRVGLSRTYSQSSADIVWGSDDDSGMPSSHRNLGSSTVAKAGFPSGGNAWKWISINDTKDTWGSKKKTSMHEFGHCLGYRHTGTSDGQFIHGTPTTETGSIMNQGSNTSPSFQTGDRRSARVFYPDSYTTPNTITVSKGWSGALKLKYKNSNFLTRPYYWIRVYRYSSSGSYLGYKDFQSRTSNSNGYHTLYWSGLSSGTTYRFAIRGYNFRKDVYSSRSGQYTVTL